MSRSLYTAWTLVFVAGTAASAQQPPASQRGTVSQTINTTVVTVEYHRPSAKGRVLFGDSALVRYDAVWTPGANRATIVELDRGARINGEAVPAGKYSIWLIPAREDWTLIINRTWDAHHLRYPGEASDVVLTKLRTTTSSHMETLAFYFAEVRAYDAVLHLHWGTTVLPIRIEVDR